MAVETDIILRCISESLIVSITCTMIDIKHIEEQHILKKLRGHPLKKER